MNFLLQEWRAATLSRVELRRRCLRACAQPVPDKNGADGEQKNQCGDRVYFRCDSAAQARPYFQRQGVVTSNQEKSDCDFVQRKRKNQKSSGNQGDSSDSAT